MRAVIPTPLPGKVPVAFLKNLLLHFDRAWNSVPITKKQEPPMQGSRLKKRSNGMGICFSGMDFKRYFKW